MGDPAGIGPEIIVKLYQHNAPPDCVIYGDSNTIEQTMHRLGLERPMQILTTPDEAIDPNALPVYQACDPVSVDLAPGRVSAEAGKAAYQCVDRAIDDALEGQLQGIITAPLNKQAIHMAGYDFPGHTEILAHRCGDVPVAMMLANNAIRVVLVTIHIPLGQVAQTITIDLEIQAIQLAHRACEQLGINAPRVAVAALNPHAGEAGKFGNEEQRIIAPAIEQARALGIDVSGPWPGDTIFGRARTGEFDVVVAQYHDQGLIPVKYLGIDEGVNITVGLPFVRTSVDHGTAFDIAGKGLASESSLAQAVDIARILVGNQSRSN
ncbi:4-hydroxythreonine-4-phosphate dehydrogenase PdxA [Orrella daihaiensis]|uniref:4-hydroxythreonine-4-phosphate dehydrogenase PdxA n=1 Tax=Orrella daihaiensis TaxID=2782176 RepID=A0ABY4ARD7_9BURK|nr:4-hydroxythreonine-4-phosphate dehydrogenase PdxA [Orrella daihaiensis]